MLLYELGSIRTNADICGYQENVTPAAQHAKANQNTEGNDMNKIQTGEGPSSDAGKNLKQEK